MAKAAKVQSYLSIARSNKTQSVKKPQSAPPFVFRFSWFLFPVPSLALAVLFFVEGKWVMVSHDVRNVRLAQLALEQRKA